MKTFLFAMLTTLLAAGCASSPDRTGSADLADSETLSGPAQERYVTGSRIPRDAGSGAAPATSWPVTVYGREDLERTSETDAISALRYLDPRFFH